MEIQWRIIPTTPATGRPPRSAPTTPTAPAIPGAGDATGRSAANQGASTVCPECYRELNGRTSKPKGSFIARHWYLTYTLILINVVAYGLQQIIPNRWVINHGVMWWPYVQHGEYYRLISYGFLHQQNDPTHLLWNMINLFLYGVSLERMMGRWKFLLVYLGSIVFGAFGVYVLAPGTSVVGASGGLFGLMGSFMTLLIIMKQKDTARVFALITAANVIYSLLTPSNISHACHAGGFVGGVLLTLLFVPFVKKPESSEPPQQSPQQWLNGR